MAAKPPKPPDHSPIAKVLNSSASDIDEDQSRCQQQQRKSDCSCTNISIMQLFHEMKQEFPTVPDHVVHQCVIDNCHDRENCIDCLNKELAAHPNTAQAYPSHVLRQSQNLICKKPLVPTRPAPVPTPKKSPHNCDSSPRQVIQNQRSIVQPPPREILLKQRNIENISPAGYPAATTAPGTAAGLPPTGAVTTETGATARSPSSDMRPQFSNCDNSRPSVPPQRPTTLNFREPQTPAFAVSTNQHHLIQQQQTQHHQQSPQNQRVQHRPVRAAPPPPVSSVRHPPLPPAAPNVQNFRSTSIQSPASFSDSGESEISVNISLSPSSSDRSKGPTRHVSSISVQPEPPYTRDFTPQSPRSFTSLNLTLRKPSATPQSPIDITAGPGLTYSSSSFDARRGYQKSFHITVTDGGGTISASRIRPKSCYNMPAEHQESDFPVVPVSVSVPMPATLPTESSNVLKTGTSMPNVAQDAIARQDPNMALQVDDEIVVRQRYIKQKLLSALETDRKRLRRMQREINVLMSPSPPESSTRLDNEILNLRCDCEKMVQEIERAGDMEDDADFYQCIYTGQRLPTQQMQGALGPPPPRLPPATATRLAPPIPIQHEQMLQQQHQFHLQNQIHQQQQHQYQQHQQQLQQRQHQQLQMHQQRLHQSETGALGAGGTRAAGPASAPPASYQLNVDDEDDINEEPWTCDLCTFQNHPLLNKCEQCEMIRIAPGTIKIVSASYTPPAMPNNSFNNQSFSNNSNNSCNNVNSNASSSNSHSSLPNNNRVANNHSINRQSSDNNPTNNTFNGLNNLSNASVNPPLVNLFMPDSVI